MAESAADELDCSIVAELDSVPVMAELDSTIEGLESSGAIGEPLSDESEQAVKSNAAAPVIFQNLFMNFPFPKWFNHKYIYRMR